MYSETFFFLIIHSFDARSLLENKITHKSMKYRAMDDERILCILSNAAESDAETTIKELEQHIEKVQIFIEKIRPFKGLQPFSAAQILLNSKPPLFLRKISILMIQFFQRMMVVTSTM